MIDLKKFIKKLKEEIPIHKKLIVRVVPMKKNHGTTSISNRDTITICINRNDSVAIQCDTLIHEWGHAKDFDNWQQHGGQWGKWMAEAYQVWEEYLNES
jgi:protein-arginine kinase